MVKPVVVWTAGGVSRRVPRQTSRRLVVIERHEMAPLGAALHNQLQYHQKPPQSLSLHKLEFCRWQDIALSSCHGYPTKPLPPIRPPRASSKLAPSCHLNVECQCQFGSQGNDRRRSNRTRWGHGDSGALVFVSGFWCCNIQERQQRHKNNNLDRLGSLELVACQWIFKKAPLGRRGTQMERKQTIMRPPSKTGGPGHLMRECQRRDNPLPLSPSSSAFEPFLIFCLLDTIPLPVA